MKEKRGEKKKEPFHEVAALTVPSDYRGHHFHRSDAASRTQDTTAHGLHIPERYGTRYRFADSRNDERLLHRRARIYAVHRYLD